MNERNPFPRVADREVIGLVTRVPWYSLIGISRAASSMDRSILTKKHGEMTQAERDALVSRYESHSACLSPPYGMRCECN